MKAIIFFILLTMLTIPTVFGQIKIGDNPQNIDPASVLELESTSKVLVITRVSTLEMEAIIPQRGGIVYNTDTECINYYDGTQWVNLCDAVNFTITNDPIVNNRATIEITQTEGGYNLEIAKNGILGDNIVDGGIGPDDIQDNSITQEKLAAESVGSSEIRQNAVGSDEIRDGSIAPTDMANFIPGQVLVTDENGIVKWGDAGDLMGAIGDEITITGSGTPASPLQITDGIQLNISNNTALIADHIVDDQDTDDTNELVDLTFTKLTNTLSISQSATPVGASVDLSGLIGSDDQQLTIDENILSLEEGGPDIDLTTYLDNTDEQTLRLTGNNLEISDGNSIILPIPNGSETKVNAGNNITITGNGTTATPYIINTPNAVIPNGSETIVNPGNNITITGNGTTATPYIINTPNAVIPNGSETIVNPGNNITITGNGTTATPYIINAADGAVADGTETIVNPGTNITITGEGSNADPYIINAADGAVADGTETIVNPGTNITITGEGSNVDPYIINVVGIGNNAEDITFNPTGNTTSNQVQLALEELQLEIDGISTGGTANPNDELITNFSLIGTELNISEGANVPLPIDLDLTFATDTELANIDGSETIVNGSPTVGVAGTGTAGDPYVLTATASDGSETIVNGSATVTVTGTGTAGNPYVLTSLDTSNGSETVVNGSPTVGVAGTGTAGDPYVLTATAADGSETIVNGSATVTVTGAGTTGNPYVLTSLDTSNGSETIVNGSATVTVSGAGTAGNPYITSIPNGVISGGPGGLILDNSITASDLQADSVDASEIRIDAVGQSEIETGGVSTDEIENFTIINEDIAPGAAIDGSKINPVFVGDVSTNGSFISGTATYPDYVFQKYYLGISTIKSDYKFSTLENIEDYLKTNHHLPGVKSVKEVAKNNGNWNLTEGALINLEKIEELFLHTIEQEKKIKQLESTNKNMASEVEALKAQMEEIKKLLLEKTKE